MFFLPNINEGEPNKLYFGLGKEEDINANKLRNTFAKLFKRIEDLKGDNILLEKIDIKNISEEEKFDIRNISAEEFFKSLAEGFLLTDYKFDKYKSKDEKEQKDEKTKIFQQKNFLNL